MFEVSIWWDETTLPNRTHGFDSRIEALAYIDVVQAMGWDWTLWYVEDACCMCIDGSDWPA